MDDIRFSVTNKSFQLEIEAEKPTTTASAKKVLSYIKYNSQRGSSFKGSTRYANLDKVLDGVPQTSYKFAKEEMINLQELDFNSNIQYMFIVFTMTGIHFQPLGTVRLHLEMLELKLNNNCIQNTKIRDI